MIHGNLRNVRGSNPKEYWKILNGNCKSDKSCTQINIESFEINNLMGEEQAGFREGYTQL